MKKILALTVALLTLVNGTAIKVNAEAADLTALASSLGAETDHLNVTNYYHDDNHPLYIANFDRYAEQSSNVENYTAFASFPEAISSGMSLGISIIEVLAHNGVIQPSDIKSGAEKLSDIVYDKESDYYITAYSAIQGHFEFDNYRKYLTGSFSYKQQAQSLIETAEKCMAENRYFLLLYDDLNNFHHAVAGIGITDGEWEFNGKKYDKCILTLDSNLITKDTGQLMPFHEKGCVYIDSVSLEYYLPAYDLSSGEEGVYLASIDNETLLSYKGPLPYGDISDETVPELLHLRYLNYRYIDYSGTVTEYNGEVHEISDKVNEDRMPSLLDYYLTGKSLDIECRRNEYSEAYDAQVVLQNIRSQVRASSYKDVRLTADEENVRISPLNENESVDYDLTVMCNEGYYSTSPHFRWRFLGETDSYIDLSVKDDGLLVSSDSEIQCRIIVSDRNFSFPRKSSYFDPIKKNIMLDSVGNVLLKYDDELSFFIDPDNDGVYDTEVQKGDVNCDGIIDGRDSTAVLTHYALSSSEKEYMSFVNTELADYDENGIVDGRDATAILTDYTKASVNN